MNGEEVEELGQEQEEEETVHSVSPEELQEYLTRISDDLDRTVEFWRQHSEDKTHGFGSHASAVH